MKRKYMLILCACFILLEGCYKDDLEDCAVMLHVYLESVMKKYAYEDITDRLDLYLYDNNGALVDKFTYSQAKLQEMDYRPVIPVQQFGEYTLVASVNQSKFYDVLDIGNMNTFQIALKTAEGNLVRDKQNDLYHGYKHLSLPYTGVINRYDTIDIYKNTNLINIHITYEDRIPQGIHLNAYLTGNNGKFNYRNVCYAESERTYIPHVLKQSPDSWEFGFTTMQIWVGSDLTLWVEEERDGEKRIVKELNIVNEIIKAPMYNSNEKLDQEDVFDLHLVFEHDYTLVALRINDWYVIRGGVGV